MAVLVTIACVIIGTTLVMLALVCHKARKNGVFIAHKTNTEIYHKRCDDCDGCGVTMLDGSIIPPENRTYQNTSNGFVQRGKIANTKACGTCQGMGRVWMEEGKPRPIAARRGWNHKWQ